MTKRKHSAKCLCSVCQFPDRRHITMMLPPARVELQPPPTPTVKDVTKT